MCSLSSDPKEKKKSKTAKEEEYNYDFHGTGYIVLRITFPQFAFPCTAAASEIHLFSLLVSSEERVSDRAS